MITTWFIAILALFTLLLLPYIIWYLIAIFTPLTNKSYASSPENSSIAVLIPSYNEWPWLIDCLYSLLDQTYSGTINIHILIQDRHDSSYPFLQTSFDLNNNWDICSNDNKNIILHLTWKQWKKEKINLVLPTIEDIYIGFLDADHRAEKYWTSSSIDILTSTGHIWVQWIRRPLSVRNFFQVYDSLQNHLWNEVLNNMYHTHGYTTFFTWTTCIFKNTAHTSLSLDTCLTEDTYLSYTLLTQCKSIWYNWLHGSYEEVAPNYASYFNRRRRWSNGHTKTMKDFFIDIRTSSHAFSQKLLLSYHSFYYMWWLILLCSFIVLWIWNFRQFPLPYKIGVLLITFVWGRYLAYRNNRPHTQLIDICIGFFNIFPWLTIFTIFSTRFLAPELFQTFISFPYLKYIFILGNAALIISYLPILRWSMHYKRPSFWQAIVHGLAYIFMLLVDIYAISSWIWDLLMWRTKRSKIKRSWTIDVDVEQEVTSPWSLSVKKTKYTKICIICITLIGLIISINDIFPRYTCWDKTHLLWKHIIYNKPFDIEHSISMRKEVVDDTSFLLYAEGLLDVDSSFSPDIHPISLVYSLDNTVIHKQSINHYTWSISFQHQLPMWWEKKTLTLDIQTKNFSCQQDTPFTTTVVEVVGDTFAINNEPFYIKWIIPSFAHRNISKKKAYTDFKVAWANAVRLYHSPWNEVLKLLEDLEILVMSQPNNSTRSNIKITNASEREKLVQRYSTLSKKMAGFPYSLFVSLWNELELPPNNLNQKIADITWTLQEITAKNLALSPLVYATYLAYVDYPGDITTINMLDTWRTYWEKAVELLASRGKPLFASEFWWFTAGSEKELPTNVRIHRMYTQTDILSNAWGIWLMFFQSHDNWWQPVVQGYNDPFSPNHPDDLRWYRSQDHIPKPELHHLKNIFADIDFTMTPTWKLRMKNRRKYSLSDIQISITSWWVTSKISIWSLAPWQSYISDINVNDAIYTYNLSYSTHKWLQHTIQHQFNPTHWTGAQLSPLTEIPLNTWYTTGTTSERTPFVYTQVPPWPIRMRIDLPVDIQPTDVLLLSGLWSNSATISQAWNNQIHDLWITQPYRDIVIPIQDLGTSFDLEKPLEIYFERKYIVYTSRQFVPRNKHILIDVDQPLIYRKK